MPADLFGSRLSPEFIIGNSRKRAAAVFEQLLLSARERRRPRCDAQDIGPHLMTVVRR
jgi:hypothetical protein